MGSLREQVLAGERCAGQCGPRCCGYQCSAALPSALSHCLPPFLPPSLGGMACVCSHCQPQQASGLVGPQVVLC